MPIYLASGSPRRRDFFKVYGIPVQVVVPADGVEPMPKEGEPPASYAVRAAQAKAQSGLSAMVEESALRPRSQVYAPGTQKRFFQSIEALEKARLTFSRYSEWGVHKVEHGGIPSTVVLAADTIVVLDDRILGKPANDHEAMEMLQALGGREHEVITGCCLCTDMLNARFAVHTRVTMRICSEYELRDYIATGEPRDKAGAYAIQGKGAAFVTSVQGSRSNVIGLPMEEVLLSLQAVQAIESTRGSKLYAG